MRTITAKELRDNLEEIVMRVQNGEQLQLTYRSKPVLTIAPIQPEQQKSRKKLAGLDAFDKAPKKPSPFDPNKSFKELYHEHLEEKYGRK